MTNEELIQNLHRQGLQPRSYSGRFMYGKYCVAVAMPHPSDYELPAGWRMDNLGLSRIVYWPDVDWKEEV